jgi:Rap1a immunity proteins
MRAVLNIEGLWYTTPFGPTMNWHDAAGFKVFKGGQRASALAWLHTGSRAYSLHLPQQADACLLLRQHRERIMKLGPLALAIVQCTVLGIASAKGAVDGATYMLRNTADLATLCAVEPADASYSQAIGFCEGFTVAAFRLLWALDRGRGGKHRLCVPTPQPTRGEVLASFLQWAKDVASESLLRPATDGFSAFLLDRYGCIRR